MRAALLPIAASLLGCTFGLGETPRTVPPGKVSGALGASMAFNQNDSARGGVGLHNFAPQLGPLRIGVAKRVDVGIATLYGTGGRTDVKVALTRPTLPWALAVRAGGGYAADLGFIERNIVVAYGGAIASLSFGDVEPYGAVTFVNHWIYGSHTQPPPPGQTAAPRAGYGDGILQLVIGLRGYLSASTSVAIEYGRWQPAQDDPGDGYAFVANDIVSLLMCVGCWSRRNALAALGIDDKGNPLERH